MKDKWLDDIKEKVSDFEMETPAGLWESIQEAMDTNAASMKKKKSFVALRRVSVAAAVFLILCCSGLFYYWTFDEKSHVAKKNLVHSPVFEPFDSIDKQIRNDKNLLAEATVHEKIRLSEKDTPIPDLPSDNENIVATDYASQQDIEKSDRDKKTENKTFGLGKKTEVSYEDVLPVGNMSETSGYFIVGASTNASGIAGAMPYGTGGNNMFNHGPSFDSGDSNGGETRMGGLLMEDLTMPGSPDQAVFEHKLPVRVSLDVAWRFSRYLALETGVSYTLLNSDISYSSIWKHLKARQSLHYVGIPVRIRYVPFEWNKFDLYVGAGMLFEKCVAGTISNNSSDNTTFTYEGCDDRPFQFSLNAAVGLQYNITKACGVFVEPGVSWYADDGSSLRTIYKEKPFNFNLNIGFRFNLSK